MKNPISVLEEPESRINDHSLTNIGTVSEIVKRPKNKT
jgi:hypothetical protein